MARRLQRKPQLPPISNLEDRLSDQERTTAQLLGRANKIQQDMVEHLTFTRGSWQEGKENRELLQDHVRTITALVKDIGKQVRTIESGLRDRASQEQHQFSGVRKLEAHHVTALTDLKSRISRGDASANKLHQDIRACAERISRKEAETTGEFHQMVDRIQKVDSKVVEVKSVIDHHASVLDSQQRELQDASSRIISNLELQMKGQLEEAKRRLQTLEVESNSQKERLETRLVGALEKNPQGDNLDIERLERKWDTVKKNLSARQTGLEEEFQTQSAHVHKVHKDFDLRLNQYAELVAKQQLDDINHIREEMQAGFGMLHESVLNMRTVLEGKQRLLEEGIHHELSQLRRMVVLV